MVILTLRTHKRTLRECLGLTKRQARRFQIYNFPKETVNAD